MLNPERGNAYPLAVLLILAWGVLSFGAVYPWAYVPLIVAAAVVGLVGLARPAESTRPPRGLAAACAGLVLVGALQLVPLPAGVRRAISPASEQFPGAQSPVPPVAQTPVAQKNDSPAPRAPLARPLSVNPQRTAVGVVLLAGWSLFLVGTTRRFTTGDAVYIVRGLILLGAVLALIGLVQRPGYDGRLYGFWVPRFGGNAFGPFSNRNHFAGWMVMALPVGLGYFCAGVAAGMRGVKPVLRERVLWFASPAASKLVLTGCALVLMAVSLVLTMSRSGISTFCAASVFLGLFSLRGTDVATRRYVLAGCLGALLVTAVGWVGVGAVADRFARDGSLDVSWGGRMAAWRDASRVFADFPLVGTGINTYETDSRIYQSPGPELALRIAEVHNDYLQVAAEGGLLLVGVVTICLGVIVREIRARFREDQYLTAYWIRAGAVSGLLAIAIQEIAEFSLQKPGNAALFIVLLALALHRPAPAAQGVRA